MQGKAGEASGEAPDGPDQRALRSEAPAGYDDSGIERELVVMDQSSCLRWFQHDFPDLLARWHYHPELELHLITASTGTAMIGGQARAFEPGSLYLLGGGVPHNWVSGLDGRRSVPGRDVLLQMHPDRLRELARGGIACVSGGCVWPAAPAWAPAGRLPCPSPATGPPPGGSPGARRGSRRSRPKSGQPVVGPRSSPPPSPLRTARSRSWTTSSS